jgi:multiple sugar transport system substrate-binding protein
MKKALYIFAAISAIGLACTLGAYAQGNSSQSSALGVCRAKGTITYGFWGDALEASEQMAATKAAAKACPNLRVIARWMQGDYDGLLNIEIGSGTAPDVFQIDAREAPKYVAVDHALTDLTAFAKGDHFNPLSLYRRICASQGYYLGRLVALPRDCGTNQMLIYNKDMFKARHVAVPNNRWTLNDMLAAAKKLTGIYSLPHSRARLMRWAIPVQQDEFRINGYIYPFGGQWLTPPNHGHQVCALTSKGSRAGLIWWRNLIFKYHVAPTPAVQVAAGGDFVGFQDERFAMYFVGPWALNYLVKPMPQTGMKPVPWHWGFSLSPSNPAHPKDVGLGVVLPAMEVVYSGSKHKYAAWEFIRRLTTVRASALEAAYGIGLPAYIPLTKSKYVTSRYAPYAATWLRASDTGRAIVRTPLDRMWSQKAFAPAMSHLFDGSMSVQQATALACRTGKQFLP